MASSASIRPLRSRLGRRIYALAAALACAPLILVGLYALNAIDSAHREQAWQALDDSLHSFGEMLFEKFSMSGELAQFLSEERITAGELPTWYANYAVIEAGEIVHTTFADSWLPEIDVLGTAERPQISFVDVADKPGVYLAMQVGERTFIGELDTFRLWEDRSQYPFATDFCLIARSKSMPVFCSTPLPAAELGIITTAGGTSGRRVWQSEAGNRHTSHWDLFLPSAFESEPLRIVGTQPEDVFASAASAIREVYVPGLILTLLLTLFGAGYHARSFLTPMAKLLAATRRFAVRDFSQNVELARDDEFQDLGNSLNSMAHALEQQFLQRDALSRLDYLILAGDSVEDVLRTAIHDALTYLPFGSIELDIQVQPDEGWFRYSFSRDSGELSKQALDELSWSQAEPGVETEAAITVGESVRGTLRGIHNTARSNFDEPAQQLEQLAERLAMALEFHEKSLELHRRAYFDVLTGLPNRESCFQKIDRAIATAEMNGHMVALLYIDLDGFKAVNDSLGHDAGDELIRLAADRITRNVGHHGVTARLGGDEFAVIIPYSAGRADDYKDIGSLIIRELAEPFKIGNSEAYLGASVGTARYPEDGDTHTELLRKADAAMYRAKDSGRGRQVEYSKTLGMFIAKRMKLEADLNRALEREEMFLVYQPQVDLRSGNICSAEALLRWNHSTEGLISPDEFITIAEETNQIQTLGNWVLFNACAQLREWRDRGIALQCIAVNVSANQLRQADFVAQVTECLEQFNLPPRMLELELTERVFVDAKETLATIHALKTLGVSVSIDDFGTGYSSLGSLRNLEFDLVKVDRAFVASLPHDKQSASIIKAVIAMCQTLGKGVVAEGIETSQQLQYLVDAGVEYGQGYYFSKPISSQEFEYVLRRDSGEMEDTIRQFVSVDTP